HIEALKNSIFNETAQKFLKGDKTQMPREDPSFCLQRDIFNFVLAAEKDNGIVKVRKKQPF
ncbi:MAG: hypothetical protein U9R17_05995, partial [Thermodesulfobacteriota bacterium]|nr:hypothetical protein [Thermodesulfobacteriota bacterium]